MSVIISILSFLLLLGILVAVHEFGHFIVAKWSGMRVDEFSIGFPPRIARWQKGETRYVFGLIPFGGYVHIFGESGDEADDADPRSFERKSVWARIAVILAGVTMNLLFAFVVLVMAFSVGFSSFAQDLTTVPGSTVVKSRVILVGIQKDSPAEKAGLLPGDIVKTIRPDNGERKEVQSVGDLQDLAKQYQAAGTYNVSVAFERDGSALARDLTIQPTGPALGVEIQSLNRVRVPVWYAPQVAIKEMRAIITITWDALSGFFGGLLFQGKLDPAVSGPIGIYNATASASRVGFEQVVFLGVALSINLALLNLLPIPALDGGRFVFLALEAVFRRRVVKRQYEQMIVTIGFMSLISLMIVLTARDIWKLF
jgi:regulator of sigma E protease